MNKLRYLFFFMLLSGSVAAQDKSEYTYQPFIMDGTCEWQSREYVMAPGNLTIDNRRVISNEDSVYQGKTYKIIYDYPDCSVKEEDKVYVGLIREEDKRVYYVGGSITGDYYDTEILLYDFNLNVGDTINYPNMGTFKVWRIDTIQVEGVWRRAFYFYDPHFGGGGYYYEGVGETNYHGILDPLADIPFSTYPSVRCVIHGNNVLYKKYPTQVDCPCSSLSSQPVVEDMGKISFYVRNRQLCIHAPNQSFTTLKIYTLDGKRVKSVTLREQTDEITSSLEGLIPGSYLFIVGSADSQQSGQFVAQ